MAFPSSFGKYDVKRPERGEKTAGKFLKIMLAFYISLCYNWFRCDVIAVKREVADRKIGFFRGANVMSQFWRQVTVPIPTYFCQSRQIRRVKQR